MGSWAMQPIATSRVLCEPLSSQISSESSVQAVPAAAEFASSGWAGSLGARPRACAEHLRSRCCLRWPAAMLVALRKSRRLQAGEPAGSKEQQPGLVSRCRAAAEGIAHHAAALRQQLAASAAGAAGTLLDAPRSQHQLLLASVSGSALEQQQQQQQPKAFLPDKRRAAGGGRGSGRNPASGAADGGGSGGGGESELFPDADENERFLISEVGAAARVAGTNGGSASC